MNGDFSPKQWGTLVVFALIGIAIGLSTHKPDGAVAGILMLVLVIVLIATFPAAWRKYVDKQGDKP